MALSSVIIDRGDTVIKTFPHTEQHRWVREVTAYRLLPFATPKLISYGSNWLEMEKITPILDMPKQESRKYKSELKALLNRVHDEGWWHCDVALVNVGVSSQRGVLLLDWENLTPATGDVSYDLEGAHRAGVRPAWSMGKNTGVYWGGPWDTCPGMYWK